MLKELPKNKFSLIKSKARFNIKGTEQSPSYPSPDSGQSMQCAQLPQAPAAVSSPPKGPEPPPGSQNNPFP